MAEEQTSQEVERHYITRNGRLLSNTCMQENSLIKMLQKCVLLFSISDHFMMDNPGYDDPEEKAKNNNTYATEWSNGGPG